MIIVTTYGARERVMGEKRSMNVISQTDMHRLSKQNKKPNFSHTQQDACTNDGSNETQTVD